MTAELKRALVEIVAKQRDKSVPSEEIVDLLLANLAAGSPEVIEAMARADCFVGCTDCETPVDCGAAGPGTIFTKAARAALAAGMRKVMEG